MRENNAHTRSDSERARPRARLRDAAESVCLCELWLCSVHGRGAAVLSSRLSVQVGLASCRIVLRALASRSSLCCTSLSRYGRRTGHGVAPPQRDPPPRARRTRCAGRRAFHILVLFSKFSLSGISVSRPRGPRARPGGPRAPHARETGETRVHLHVSAITRDSRDDLVVVRPCAREGPRACQCILYTVLTTLAKSESSN